MSRNLFFIPLGGSGGSGDLSNYYTKSQVDTLIQDFITSSVNDLVNYYTKTETYTQAEVNTLIGSIESIHFEFAASTSDVQDPQSNLIYLIGPSGTGADQYEEYVYANNQWTKIGDTSIDLSGYATTTDLQNAINLAMTTLQNALGNYYNKSEVDEMLQGVQTLQGIQGIKGADGVNGVDGLQGIQGIKGVDGLQGIQGPAGGGSGGGATRYDIATKSQDELADFYQNWQTIMASNDVYLGVYPVTTVIPEYTVGDYTALLLEYNIGFGLELNATTQTTVVNGQVGAWYILPNGTNGEYSSKITMPTKDYVDAVANTKQDTLTAGEGISIQGTTISATGGGASKIELLSLPMEDLLQFYQDTLAGTMKDFSQYTGNGYPIINAYKMNSGWVVDTSFYTGTEGTTYTTDGTEIAIILNQMVEAVGTQGNETKKYLRNAITLFSPTIYQTYGGALITYILIGYSNVAQLQFVLADDSVVDYTVLTN